MFFSFIHFFVFNNFLICSDLQAPCAYFGIQIDYLKTKLISKRLEFKEHQENKQIDQTFTVDKAMFTRDALAKSIYSRIFDYLIHVNPIHFFS
jgi:myosin heavy subunit